MTPTRPVWEPAPSDECFSPTALGFSPTPPCHLPLLPHLSGIIHSHFLFFWYFEIFLFCFTFFLFPPLIFNSFYHIGIHSGLQDHAWPIEPHQSGQESFLRVESYGHLGLQLGLSLPFLISALQAEFWVKFMVGIRAMERRKLTRNQCPWKHGKGWYVDMKSQTEQGY